MTDFLFFYSWYTCHWFIESKPLNLLQVPLQEEKGPSLKFEEACLQTRLTCAWEHYRLQPVSLWTLKWDWNTIPALLFYIMDIFSCQQPHRNKHLFYKQEQVNRRQWCYQVMLFVFILRSSNLLYCFVCNFEFARRICDEIVLFWYGAHVISKTRKSIINIVIETLSLFFVSAIWVQYLLIQR